jgi:IS30 family transposase
MEIKALHRHGWSVTRIAQEFDLARGTVYAELASSAVLGEVRDQAT